MLRKNRISRFKSVTLRIHRSLVARLSRELNESFKRRTRGFNIRDNLNLVIQIGILIVLGLTCYSNSKLANATRKNTKQTEELLYYRIKESEETLKLREATEKYAKETKKLRRATDSYAKESHLLRRATEENTAQLWAQFKLSIEPRMHGYICERDVYFEWHKRKYVSPGVTDQTPREGLATYLSGGVSCYLSTQNTSVSYARDVSAYVIKKDVPGVFPSIILEPGISPNSSFVFLMGKNPVGRDGIKTRLVQRYGEKATSLIFDPIYLPNERDHSYHIIVYEDLMRNLYVTKTLFAYEPTTKRYVNIYVNTDEFTP